MRWGTCSCSRWWLSYRGRCAWCSMTPYALTRGPRSLGWASTSTRCALPGKDAPGAPVGGSLLPRKIRAGAAAFVARSCQSSLHRPSTGRALRPALTFCCSGFFRIQRALVSSPRETNIDRDRGSWPLGTSAGEAPARRWISGKGDCRTAAFTPDATTRLPDRCLGSKS